MMVIVVLKRDLAVVGKFRAGAVMFVARFHMRPVEVLLAYRTPPSSMTSDFSPRRRAR